MPNVVVYVPAAKWRAMTAAGFDPAQVTRECAMAEMERRLRDAQGASARALSADHFKPDPKPTKGEKKGRR